MEARFRRHIAAEIDRQSRQILSAYGELGYPPAMTDEAVRDMRSMYVQMVEMAIRTFGKRMTTQGKALGYDLEMKDFSFSQFFHSLALAYVNLESVRRRITAVTETTRNQIVLQIDRGQQEGLGVDAIASLISDRIPSISRSRGALIARTELHGAANYGAHETAKQTGLELLKEWVAVEDMRTRDFGQGDGVADEFDHRSMDGQTVKMDDPFMMPWRKGPDISIMFPGDPSAPPGAVINCLPPWANVRLAGIKRAMSCEYSGNLFKFSFAGPVDFTVTANHPVLTLSGWKPARLVKEGDKLIHCGPGHRVPFGVDADVEDGHARVDEVYNALQSLGRLVRSAPDTVDFHGDVPNGDVDIVSIECQLRDRLKSEGLRLFGEIGLTDTHIPQGALLARRMVGLSERVSPPLLDGDPRRRRSSGSGFWAAQGGLSAVPFADIRADDAQVSEATVDHSARQVELSGDAVDGVPGFKKRPDLGVVAFPDFAPPLTGGAFELVEVTSVHSFHYDGPVYNLETDNGLIVSDGIVNHNCRCAVAHMVKGLDD